MLGLQNELSGIIISIHLQTVITHFLAYETINGDKQNFLEGEHHGSIFK